MNRCLSISQAAAYCGVSESTFRANVAPYVPSIAIGARRVWDRLALDEWIGEKSGVKAAESEIDAWLATIDI